MNIQPKQTFQLILPYLKKWWFSIVFIPFCWVLMVQFWMALKWEISFAWLYDYPLFLTPFFLLIDGFLLIIHEAGHTFFSVFGSRFLTILGGTLLELLIPFLIAVYGWFNYKQIIAQIGLLLTGFAWLETSAYAADPMARRMPLLGNLPKSAHDFHNLFSMAGVLDQHMTFAWLMYWMGVACILLFLTYPIFNRQSTSF